MSRLTCWWLADVMLEPIMIIVLGGIVMTIVLAIFLPMIQIITGLKEQHLILVKTKKNCSIY